ncbi:hypothetical protein [Candidatus Magnetominusculus xianensis]|nr:hypothetical protein [Candidatus Magnetominusculus xianensis]MBF0404463.1 hypothetical protein [Nitrospirota bacterium]
MEAFQVLDGDYTAAIMRTLLNKHSKSKIEILNTGVSGNGTVAELFRYRKYLKSIKPNIVLLFFLIGNDFRDNSCELSIAVNKNKMQLPCAYVEKDAVIYETNVEIINTKYFHLIPNSAKSDLGANINGKYNRLKHIYKTLRGYIKYNFPILSAMVMDLLDAVASISKSIVAKKDDGISIDNYIYDPPVKQQWLDAWKITEDALLKLNQEISDNGGRLIVIINAEYPYSEIRYPEKKLTEIAIKDNITIFSLTNDFISYKKQNDLKVPYFASRCDGHWNPLGHFIAANVVSKYLIDNNLVPIGNDDKQGLSSLILKNLNRSPQDILGTGFNQIYRNGFFEGQTNIEKILSESTKQN